MVKNIRKNIFWALDSIKGSKISNHYEDVKSIHENISVLATQKREEYLQKLLKHSSDNVPFYKQFQKANSLQQFPVVNKTLIKKNFKLFKSLPHLKNKNHLVSTSGSTGSPFKIYQDANKKARNTADIIYFGEKAGFNIGAKLYYFRLWGKHYRKNKLLAWMQNIVMCPVSNFQEANINNLITDIKKNNNVKGFIGYISALEEICKYLDHNKAKPIHNNIKSIISIAEPLNDYVAKNVKKYFNVNPVSRYSNSENGIIAQQNLEQESNYFEINWASYHIEILDMKSDTPVEKGQIGRIVITDLFNYCMPLIRYDSGDIGVLNDNPFNNKKPLVLTKIEGRKMDLFLNTKGEYVSSHVVHDILQYEGID